MPIIWITGLPNAGKTVVADSLAALLRGAGKPTMRLDGDLMRLVFGWSDVQAAEDREHLARRYVQVAEAFSSQSLFCVVSVVGLFAATFRDLDASEERTLPVFLEVPEDELSRRDERRIYSGDRLAELHRLTSQVPQNVARLENHSRTPDETARDIFAIMERGGFFQEQGLRKIDTPAQLLATARSRTHRTQYWDQYYANRRSGPDGASPFAETVAEALAQRRVRRILDFGCGDGRDTFFLAGLAPTIGVDLSRAAVEACLREAKRRGIDDPQFVSTSDVELSQVLTSARPDVIYSRFVLHAMTSEEQVTFLRTISDALTWDSMLLLECRATDDELQRSGVRVSEAENVVGHYRRFVDPEVLRAEVERLGWEVNEFVVGRGLAKHASGDPRVVRIVASRGGSPGDEAPS